MKAMRRVHSEGDTPAGKREAGRYLRPVASRCVGSVAWKPATAEVVAAVAHALAIEKRQQLQAESAGTAGTLYGSGRPASTDEGGGA